LIAYHQFKKQFNEIPLTRKQKERISFELKSSVLESSFPQIKRKLLYKLNLLNCKIVYSFRSVDGILKQDKKESLYLDCLKSIVNGINDDITIITIDELGSYKFESIVIQEISKLDKVKSIRKDSSFNSKGLQFADNVCGVIRKHISNTDTDNYYEIIERKVKKY